MNILIINETCGIGSHGKICLEIAKQLEENGNVVKIAYGRDFYVPEEAKKYAVPIGNKFSFIHHALITRLFDKHGLGSKIATKKFLKWADSFKPDLIWLHNIHGYYINFVLLFDWIKHQKDLKEIKWTLHDCWALTGHCSHFMSIGCDKWKTQCCHCPLKRDYPKSVFIDNSYSNYIVKKKSFTGVQNMELIVPSNWLKCIVKESFLKDYKVTLIRNKINTNVFRKKSNPIFKTKYNLYGKTMVLAVANVWTPKKGLNDFITLSNLFENKDYVFVMVGVSKKEKGRIPKSIITIEKTNNQDELVDIYSSADYFVNLTYEDNYPTVNLEAEACGAIVITYNTGGCSETVTNKSFVVEAGDLQSVYNILIAGIKK